jgi:exopolysaccharide biosynthesis protein
MEKKRMKHRIKQTITAFLTTIIVTLIILNTGNRNTDLRKQGIRTPQQEQCTHKQVNRDEKEDSRSMDNECNATGRTPQTSINNQHKQSKAREELDRTIDRYKELNTRTN